MRECKKKEEERNRTKLIEKRDSKKGKHNIFPNYN
jgi:hypothetical protein